MELTSMQWDSVAAFWDMGGYGLYVWGSYAVTALLIVAEVVGLRRGLHQRFNRLQRLQVWEADQ